MKTKILIINLLCFGFLFNPTFAQKITFEKFDYFEGDTTLTFEESKQKWEELKSEHGNSYIYQTGFGSVFGFGYLYEIRVEDGVIVSRKYKASKIKNGKSKITEQWIEKGDKIGTKNDYAPPKTIDELYELAEKEYLDINEEENYVYFYTFPNGILKTCGYFPKNCADDCFEGVKIIGIKWID